MMKKLLVCFAMFTLQGIIVQAQGLSGNIPTLDKLLKLRWTHEVGCWSPYDGLPLYYNGMIIPYQDVMYVLDAETGEKILFGSQEVQEMTNNNESLVFFENFHKNKQKVEHKVVDLLTSKVLVNQYNKRLVYVGHNIVTILNDGITYFPKDWNTLVAVDAQTSNTIWEFTADSIIYTKPKVHNSLLCFGDLENFYALDKDTGVEQWRVELGEIVSSIEINDNYAYLWAKPSSLLALNLDTHRIEWAFSDVPAQKNNYNLLLEGDTIYFSSTSIFAINRKDGSLIWRSEYEDSYSGVHIALCDNYVLYYDVETDREAPPLTALDKFNGKIAYQYFTSDTYPQDFENVRELNRLDYATMYFMKTTHENMLYGISQDKIYAFEVLK